MLRDKTMKAGRQRRAIARKRRMEEALRVCDPSARNDDGEAKLRSVFSAIRAYTNTDIDLNTSMAPSDIFRATLKALSDPSCDKAARESKFVGEALELVSKLNSVLAVR